MYLYCSFYVYMKKKNLNLNTKRNKYNCFKFNLKKKKMAKFENWPLKIYIRIIKHYTDIDPSGNTRPRISCL